MSKNTTISLLNRRDVLKLSFAVLAAGVTGSLLRPAYAAESAAGEAGSAASGKTLIAYFTRTGNTQKLAEQIHSRVGGDMFEVRATHAYPEAYRATTDQAKKEQESNFRPTLTAQVADMASYKTVFIGYPNWWGTLPMALFTFLESYDFAGKTLVPFCTHGGSALGRGPADIAKLCPKSTILEGLAVKGGNVATAQGNVDAWLKRLNLV